MTSVSDSLSKRQERIQPPQTNNYGNAHGGELIKIMDEMAAISAMKVASDRCVTAHISEVEFHNPVREGGCSQRGSVRSQDREDQFEYVRCGSQ